MPASKMDTFSRDAIATFRADPPTTQFQRGYLAALATMRRECIGAGDLHANEGFRVLAETLLPEAERR